MNVGSVVRGSFIAVSLYAVSPFVQVGLIDRVRHTFDASVKNENLHRLHSAYLIKNSLLFKVLLRDGAQVTDPFNFWAAKLRPDLDQCLTDEVSVKYSGSVEFGIEDNAECLSQLTGVSVEFLKPRSDDALGWCSYRYRNGLSTDMYVEDTCVVRR